MTDGEFKSEWLKRWAWWLLKWSAVLLAVGAVIYWQRFSSVPVEVVSVQRGMIVAEVMGTGTLEARVSTTVSSKISGRIEMVFVDQGERVYADKQLVQLDDKELQEQVAIANANLDTANAAVVRLKADKDRAIAVFEQTERHHERMKALSEKNAAAQDDLDRAVESLAVASAEMARAEAAITEGEKGKIAAEKTLEYHRARLADTAILAPFDGLIVARHREAGDIAVPGSAILTLISTDVLWIKAWVDETEMDRLAIEQPVRVVFRSNSEKSFSGKVTRLGRESDRETREFVVDVQVTELPANWAVGQRAEVYIEVARKENGVIIPSSLLIRRDGEQGVFVAQNGVAKWRTLKLGLQGRDTVEVVEGLDETDQVIQFSAIAIQAIAGRRVHRP